jgi:hypothetical protein
MHLDIVYVLIHNNIYESRKAKTTYNLERREYIFFSNIHVLHCSSLHPLLESLILLHPEVIIR